MKLHTVEVHSTSQQVHRVSDFTVNGEGADKKTTNDLWTGKNAIKIGVCFFMMLAAFAIRMTGVPSEGWKEVGNFTSNEPLPTDDALGALRFVEREAKWSAPVKANDVELLRDSMLLRLSAVEETVRAGIEGKVLSIDTDAQYGNCVSIAGEDDIVLKIYGLETIELHKNDTVQADTLLGSVPVGRSLYVAVEKAGLQQDPSQYIDLSVHGRNAML